MIPSQAPSQESACWNVSEGRLQDRGRVPVQSSSKPVADLSGDRGRWSDIMGDLKYHDSRLSHASVKCLENAYTPVDG
jgi:hypothetical protein